MRYAKLNRLVKSITTLGELLRVTQPELWQALGYHVGLEQEPRDITGIVTGASYLTGDERGYARLMEERPKPGRAGDGDV